MPQLKQPSSNQSQPATQQKPRVRVPIMGHPGLPAEQADLIVMLENMAMGPLGMAGKFGPDDVPAAGMDYLRKVLSSMFDGAAGAESRSTIMPMTSQASERMFRNNANRALNGMSDFGVQNRMRRMSGDNYMAQTNFGKSAQDVNFPIPSPGATPPRPTLRGNPGGDALEKGSMYGVQRARDASNAALRDLGQPPGSANDIGGLGLLKLIESIMTDPSSARKLFGR